MLPRSLFTRYIIPALGLAGLGYGVLFTTVLANPAEKPAQQLNLPPTSAYPNAISGSGLIEANSRNIVIGSHLSGVVAEVMVTEGDMVQAGAPLFKLDDRSIQAEVAVRQSDLTASEAQIREAEARLADQQDQLQRAQNLKPGVSVTTDRVDRLRFAVRTAAAQLQTAKANLEAAKAQLQSAEVTLAKHTVNAPISGRILKVSLRPGEYVQATANEREPIVMGNDKPLYVRVSIDENDLWRLKPDAEAKGALRSNRDISFPLQFVRIEPYVIPKRSLTGSTSERVDTRILEAIFSIGDSDLPLYIGQQVDVFIADTKAEK